MDLFTVGHSNHPIEPFISLLQQHGVTALADVRSHPHSRHLPHFNKAELTAALESQGIRYVFLGKELGARSGNPACYVEGKAVYEKIAATDEFQAGLQRVISGLQTYNIALMCAEQDPLTCHRAILVCHHLKPFNLTINHILKTGELESHDQLESRLLSKQGFTEFADPTAPVQLSLFSNNLPSREDCLEEAYKRQGDEIAYVEKQGGSDRG
ncbi:MAG: DUF488 family protein [Limnospira sp.]